MITAVDSTVLIDVFTADRTYGRPSAAAVRDSLAHGRLVACDAVWAEVTAVFDNQAAAEQALSQLGVGFSPLDSRAAARAGAWWREYRRDGGSRARVIADFLIAAHAVHHADRLLTRDRGFFRGRFEGLEVFDPSTGGRTR